MDKFLVYFHNLSYDAAFILKEYVKISSFLMINGSVLQFKVCYQDVNIIFRDSNRIFASKLKDLPKMFLSEYKQSLIFKEIFPYEYYTLSKYVKHVGNI